MQEFEQKILEQYDIEVNSTRKVRGAVLCETNKGVFLLKEITTSEKRIPALCEVYTWLYEQGIIRLIMWSRTVTVNIYLHWITETGTY